jgi:GTP-binding protein YchF
MKIKVALVGLPNVGKSTLFNAIAQKSIADVKNFPFCTIEPNIAPIPIPDAGNLQRLAQVANSKKALPATIFLVDVAGLVKGASRGEGLGNQFLATVRECNLIIHVVRSYDDADVIHVEGKVDPVADAEVVNLELLLADLAHVQRRLVKSTCIGEEREVLLKIEKGLESGQPARSLGLTSEEEFSIKYMGLLTLKPVIYAFNVDEVDYIFDRDASMAAAESYVKQLQYCDLDKDSFAVVSAKFESELSTKSDEDKCTYLDSIGVGDDIELNEQMSYHRLPLLVKDVLDLGLVYTGPGVPPERSQTTKTHIIPSSSMSVLDLAGKLHGDIQKGFMNAEVICASDLVQYETYGAAKDGGSIRMEGKDYLLQSGDVALIKWK